MTMLTIHDCEVCARAVEHFGRRAQLLKVAEELIELAVECWRAADDGQMSFVSHLQFVELCRLRGRPSYTYATREPLMECMALERADVEVMLYQLSLMEPTLAARVPAKIASQIARLQRRMEGEE